jgi:hypothetical protein
LIPSAESLDLALDLRAGLAVPRARPANVKPSRGRYKESTMSNRLEQEFPDTGWHAVPQIGAPVLDRDPVQRGVDRGRRLRAQAIRSSARDGTAAARIRRPGHARLHRDRSSECGRQASPVHGA